MWWIILIAVLGCCCCSICGAAGFMFHMMDYLFDHAVPQKPTEEDDNDKYDEEGTNPLFDQFPDLRKKIAWRKLGNFPSAVHQMTFDHPKTGKKTTFYLKREDMVSDMYGGNKIRTMEYQFACGMSRLKDNGGGDVWGMGGIASNQAVIMAMLGEKENIETKNVLGADEGSSWDNSFNLVTLLSTPTNIVSFSILPKIIYRLWKAPDSDFKIFAGGNSRTGQFGHVGGFLELCKQVKAGEMPPPTDIVLAIGSSCTISGLTLGYCMAKKLGILPEGMENIKIRGAIIHHMLSPFIVNNMMSKNLPKTAAMMVELGLPDVSDLIKAALKDNVVLNADFSGKYGSPTKEQMEASEIGKGSKITPNSAPHPWFCTTFSGKALAYALSLEDLGETLIFWCTKSLIQPFVSKERYESQFENAGKMEKKWLKEGEWDGAEALDVKMKHFTKMSFSKDYATIDVADTYQRSSHVLDDAAI